MKPSQLREYYRKGVVMIVQLTPFKYGDEELDLEGLKMNTEFLVEASRKGPLVLTPAGSTGEHYTLNDEEYKKVLKTVVDVAGGKVPVVPGAGHSGTKAAIERAKYAQDIGADGVMVVLPYYHVPTEEGLYLHYSKLCQSIDIGVVIYNNPDVSKIYMKPHILRRLAEEYDNIVAVKENTPNVAMLYDQIRRCGDKVPILQGRGEWWFGLTAHLGVRGYISGYANFMPELCIELLHAGLNKNHDKLFEIMRKIEAYEDFISEMGRKYGPSTTILPPPYVDHYMVYPVMKATMDMLGLRGGSMRLPLINLKDEDKKKLEDIVFNKLGLKKIK
jgi:4-hydroxy-tetrahydrodipicolinate synthase